MKRPKRSDASKALISDALLCLLKNTPYDEINISDICTLATVSRNTFYRNFKSKDAVLDQYLLTKCQYIIRQFEQNESYDPLRPTKVDLLRGYERFFGYWKTEQELIDLLMKQSLQGHLLSAMNASVVNSYSEQWIQGLFSEFPDYYYNWLSASLCSILLSWAEHGFDLPPRKVGKLLLMISSSVTAKASVTGMYEKGM